MNEGVIIKKCKKEIEDSHSKVKTYLQFFEMFDIGNPLVLEDQIKQLNNHLQKQNLLKPEQQESMRGGKTPAPFLAAVSQTAVKVT